MNLLQNHILKRKAGIIHLSVFHLIKFEIIFILFERILIQLGLPHSIIYVVDISNIILLFFILQRKAWKQFSWLVLIYLLINILSFCSAIINYRIWNGNLLFTLIEIRNIVRFPIFFIACVAFLDESNYKNIYKIITIFFFINIPIIIYQYFTFHPPGVWTRGDMLNGLFGTDVGGNTFLNILMLIIVVYLLTGWAEGRISIKFFLMSAIASLLVAALIELKAFFLEFLFLYTWYLIKKRKTVKEIEINVITIVLILFVSYFSLQIMYKEYPWFRETMTLSGLIKFISSDGGYTGSGDLSRFTGVLTIAVDIFKKNPLTILFGIGVGNGSAFTLGEQSTRFYSLYQRTHYNWFSGTFTFVQNGAIGLLLYIFTFIYLALKKRRNNIFRLNSQIICMLAIFLVFYGEALKTDAGYLVYFAIASGFVKTYK